MLLYLRFKNLFDEHSAGRKFWSRTPASAQGAAQVAVEAEEKVKVAELNGAALTGADIFAKEEAGNSADSEKVKTCRRRRRRHQ
eukprot:852328-Pleurochrysis_carterae.AAC.3